jgi:hypothetical protein
MRKPWTGRPRKRNRTNDGPSFIRHPFSDVDHATLLDALNKLGERRLGEFPKLLATIQDLLGKKYPLHALAILATYALQVGVTNRGVKGHSGGRWSGLQPTLRRCANVHQRPDANMSRSVEPAATVIFGKGLVAITGLIGAA